mmetsp:Transcript_20896/g.58075  ORF Transcript_20896/g.58075 Transcript_20896/m.58075 type:complete len:290 (+) Transcript_20896:598-1467(+)
MCCRHAVSIHLRHEDGMVPEDSRQEFRPLVTDAEGITGRHPVGWSGCKDKSSFFLRHVVNRTVRTDNVGEVLLDRIHPLATKGIILCRWMTLRDLAYEFVLVSQFPKELVPLVQGHVRKVVDEWTLHEHVGIDQDDDVVIPFGDGYFLVVVTPFVSKMIFHPVFQPEGFVPVLGLLVVESFVRQLFSVFRREVDQEIGVHDRELFLVEFSHFDFVLGTASGHNPCHGSLLSVKHRVEEEQIGLPIVRQGARRGKDDVNVVGFVVVIVAAALVYECRTSTLAVIALCESF